MTTPKRNEAVAFHDRLFGMKFDLFLDANGEPEVGNMLELRLAATIGELALFETKDHSILYPASVVEALQGEVSRLRERNAALSLAAYEAERRLSYLMIKNGLKIDASLVEQLQKAMTLKLEPPTDGR